MTSASSKYPPETSVTKLRSWKELVIFQNVHACSPLCFTALLALRGFLEKSSVKEKAQRHVCAVLERQEAGQKAFISSFF